MTEYYIIKENKQHGPFSKEQLIAQNVTPNTKIWFYGLEDWTNLADVRQLRHITRITIAGGKTSKIKRVSLSPILIITCAAFIFWVGYNFNDKVNLSKLFGTQYNEISSNAFESDANFDMYLEKFYRDASFLGVYPKKPKKTTIKFSRLDQIDGTTHVHGVSFGVDNDDIIEIYINPSTWENFNKPMRYMLMYHELAHDVLNLDDLDANQPNDENLLMYPELSDSRSVTMDDFIESSQKVFEQYRLSNP